MVVPLGGVRLLRAELFGSIPYPNTPLQGQGKDCRRFIRGLSGVTFQVGDAKDPSFYLEMELPSTYRFLRGCSV